MSEEQGLTPYETREILFYKTENGEVRVEILLFQENLWLTQAKMAELFEVQNAAISKHLKNIFESGELSEDSVVSKMETTAADGYTCQVHLNEGFFHTALPTAIPLNDSGLKGDLLELGHLQGNVPGSGGEVAAVVAAAITLPLLIALVPGCLGQFLRLGLQQFVESFLYATSYQLLEFALDYGLV